MKWSYKTVHFELKKEGLLGGSFLDETEVEEQLNQYGRSGWELTSVIEVQDGIIAFFKQPLDLGFSVRSQESAIDENNVGQVIDAPYETEKFYEAEDEYRLPEQTGPEASLFEEQNHHPEEHEFDDHNADDSLSPENEEEEPHFADDDADTFEHQESNDERDEHPDQRGIGAIRIE
ncbi:MAG: DUF4177 domain-containing protein [Desulfofustis sp.]|nr:DUF4177 domain-containing protein [Desulfofustis sp.]